MQSIQEIDALSSQASVPLFMQRIKHCYAQMDHQYELAAQHYGFNCTGCEDNCCQTRFYHHTYLEFLYLRRGFNQLEDEKKRYVTEKARAVIKDTQALETRGLPIRLMCPLNFGGSCLIYSCRPMICRLHGIPHELQRPGNEIIRGPGCEAFMNGFGEKHYFRFDRTPFYLKLAAAEQEFKAETGLTGKFKMTIAEMILF